MEGKVYTKFSSVPHEFGRGSTGLQNFKERLNEVTKVALKPHGEARH
jgi:hypothetical protein